MIKGLLVLLHTVLFLGTLAVSVSYFDSKVLDIPMWFRLFVAFGVFGVSIFWTLFHVIGGGVMGAAAGGVLDGMRLGLFLGLGMGVGRLWPYAGAVALAAVIFAPKSQWWVMIGVCLVALALFVLDMMIRYIWSKAT